MTTVYWQKDEPDDFQVKDINVPGVFPRPSLNINSSSVTATAKPWLRPKGNRTTGSKHEQLIRNQSASLGRVNQTAPLAGETTSAIGEKPTLISHSKASASLKDLSFEDKKRVTNLIKELAKAGEERKLAVNALHQERTIFQGKEESLKRQQEKLISERDELREKILEYQFLINQYSRHIQHEQEEANAEIKESVTKEKQISLGNAGDRDELMNVQGNLKPPLPVKDLDEEIQTYYSVPPSTDSKHYNRTPVCSKQNNYKEDRSKRDEVASDINQANLSPMHQAHAKPSEGNASTQASAKMDTQLVSTEKSDSGVQRTLLEQQTKLLEQQEMIQHQLENLQMLQQKYAKEFSQIITYSEDLKQAISAEKITEIDRQEGETNSAIIMTRVSKDNLVDGSINEEKEASTTSGVGNGYKHAGIQLAESRNCRLDASSHSQKHPYQQQPVKLDSYVNKSIEQIPGYLLHTYDASSQEKPMPDRTPKTPALARLNAQEAHKSSNTSPAGSMVAHQWQPAMQREMFANVPYHSSSRSTSSLPLHSSISSRKSSNSISNTNVGNHFPQHELPHGNIKGENYKSKKQYSLLQSFEDFENEHVNDEDENLFNPGTYTGFARSILEGKCRNEHIFASTDYSEDESEPEDNDLLADMFFLKRS